MGEKVVNSSVQSGLLDAQAARLLDRARSAGAKLGAIRDGAQEAKIEKSSKDFESILLGGWLQEAEKSFATVPGGDEEDGQDPGRDQFQGMAMQALASSLTASGGIGVAKMIAEHLRSAAQREVLRAEGSGS